ncbi:MAG: stage V sporulation protein AD [Bacilli bacterium]|nr:stage V sporulation protein AD [Bacilli bacterium]
MTFYYKHVYLDDTATIVGPYEKKGPLHKYFDKTYNDLYFGKSSFEKAEVKLVRDALVMLMKKTGLKKEEIDLVIGSDLLNQITASTYGCSGVGKSFIGVYGACSSSVLGMIIAANFIEARFINNAFCIVSSHNMTSEKQFRYPTEYGALRPNSATFTATGAAASCLTYEKTKVRIEAATLGRIIDYEQNDPNDMGRVMAPSAIDTLVTHFNDTGRTPEYYDLILTGDLGKYGMEIVKDYLKELYQIDISNNYNDCGVMLYNLREEKEVKAGGSGPVCSALVAYGYVFDLLKKKRVKRVLLLATGALFSPLFVYQKENINSICHAISLEAI